MISKRDIENHKFFVGVHLRAYASKGRKHRRRLLVPVIRDLAEFALVRGEVITSISKRCILNYYATLPSRSKAIQAYSAVRAVWKLIGRTGKPPKPPILHDTCRTGNDR